MTSARRQTENEQLWRKRLVQFRGSGLTVRKFCQNHSLTESAFYFWKRTIADRDAAPATGKSEVRKPKPKSKSKDAALIPVTVVAEQLPARQSSDNGCVEIETPGGYVIRINAACSSQTIEQLLRAVNAVRREESSC